MLRWNAEAASELYGMVKDFVDYGRIRNTLERMEKRLEVARQ